MGIPGSVCSLLLTSLLLLLLLALSCHGQPRTTKTEIVQITRLDVSANFAYRKQFRFFPTRIDPHPFTRLPAETLSLSTVKLCDPMMELKECEPCLRIEISLNTTEFPRLKRFLVQTLEESTNKYHSFQIKTIGNTVPSEEWKVRYDMKVTPGQYVIVRLKVSPWDLMTSKTHFVKDSDAKPEFHFEHLPEQREIKMSLSEGSETIGRLCYQGPRTCDPLREDEIIKNFNGSQNITLKYNYFLPCLCMEVYYLDNDSTRNKICPFEEHPNAYEEDFWHTEDTPTDSNTQMRMRFNSPCNPPPKACLCKKYKNNCLTIPDAVVLNEKGQNGWEFFVDSVDKDPHLCLKFMHRNRSRVKCPNVKDHDWNVTLSKHLFRVDLHFVSRIKASFIATMCQQNQSTGHCEPQSLQYNVTRSLNQSKTFQLSLPIPCKECCVQVWRSDVRFAHKHLLCPDFSYRHIGLVFLGSMLIVFTLVLVLFLSCQRILKICTASPWSRTVLLVYSPDSAEYKILISAFANFLHKNVGCEVIFDLWDVNAVSKVGIIPWFYQKREMVTQQKGNVIILWTRKSKLMYKQWKEGAFSNLAWRDPINLFGAAMSCLQRDLKVGNLEDYSMVYFEGLCDKGDIPTNLSNIARYRLFKDLYKLVSKLQDATCLSPPCLIKAGAKYLLRRLISSEKSKGLQHDVDLYRQKLLGEFAS